MYMSFKLFFEARNTEYPFGKIWARDAKFNKRVKKSRAPKEVIDDMINITNMWKANKRHPNPLLFNKLETFAAVGRNDYVKSKLKNEWRGIGVRAGRFLIWLWIGSHEDYNKVWKDIVIRGGGDIDVKKFLQKIIDKMKKDGKIIDMKTMLNEEKEVLNEEGIKLLDQLEEEFADASWDDMLTVDTGLDETLFG